MKTTQLKWKRIDSGFYKATTPEGQVYSVETIERCSEGEREDYGWIIRFDTGDPYQLEDFVGEAPTYKEAKRVCQIHVDHGEWI